MKITTAIAPLALALLAGLTFGQPSVKPVDPSDVPESVRKAFDEQQRRREMTPGANPQGAQPANPHAAHAGHEGHPAPVVREKPTITSADADVKAAANMLVGTFRGEVRGETPALTLASAIVKVDGLDNAVYFEVSRADSPHEPFRQGLVHFYKRQGQLRLRQFEFGKVAATFGDAVTGMWLAPEVFPVLKLDQLSIALDMPVELSPGQMMARTTEPFPTTYAGATEVRSTWKVTADTVAFDDAGLDASGKQVFGSGPVMFSRTKLAATVETLENGLVILELVPTSAGETTIMPGVDAATAYSGWLTTGEIFGSSANQTTGEEVPLRFTQGKLIEGFNQGVLGAGRGSIRRLYVPAAIGYGARPRGRIPANADLIFQIQPMWVSAKVTDETDSNAGKPVTSGSPSTQAQPGTPGQPAAQPGQPGGPQAVPADQVPAAVREAFERQRQQKAAEEERKRKEEEAKKAQPAAHPGHP